MIAARSRSRLSLRRWQIGFVQHNDLRATCQLGLILPQFFIDLPIIIDRVAPIDTGGIDQMQQQAGALDMPQKIEAQANAAMCALDQARDVGDNKAIIAHAHHAKIWLKRRKGICADFGSCSADDREQCRFAGVRKAYQADIGQQLQLQVDLIRLTWLPSSAIRGT